MFADLDRTPRSLLVSERSSFLDEKNRLSSQMEQLHFVHKVSLLLPECSSTPSYLDHAFSSFSSFYLIRNLPIYELLDKDFLETAVYQGLVSGLSFRTRIDEDNCVALTPNGHLVLSLDKDSFELLGVEGKPSRFNHRTNSRFVVSVDLTQSNMAPGEHRYQRLLSGLRARLQLKTDFLLSRRPGGGACLQDILSRYEWAEHTPEVRGHSLVDLPCPPLRSCDPHSLLEWIGAAHANVSCDSSSSSFLSSMVCPEPKTTLSRARSVSVCGFLLPDDVQRLVQSVRSHLDSWASLTVHGFVDSPVSWGGQEQEVLTGGENFYSLLLFHDHTYHLHLATGAPHTCPP
ncbi:uncharacterized protein V6R79_011206 [Siganus canaliculatus]